MSMGRSRRVQELLDAGKLRVSCGDGDGRIQGRNQHRIGCNGWLLLVGVVLATNVADGLAEHGGAYECVDSNFRGAPRLAAPSIML
jgi:hypothetical protein